jgi:RHS repeat-associated protein
MKPSLFKLASGITCLLVAGLTLPLSAQNVTTPPTATTPNNTQGPCGNPAQSDPSDCDDECEENVDYFTLSTGSACASTNINSYNGNAHRKINDLKISGSVGKQPLSFTRFSNTRLSSRNLATGAFGAESPWSHNFEWLMRDNGGAPTRPIITITYPDGKERSFWYRTGSTTEWVTTTPYKNPDRIISTGDDFVLHTGELIKYHFKRRFHSVTGGVFYRIEGITDQESNTYTISYNDPDDTSVRQITDAAGHWIKLHYRDESILASDPTKLNTAAIPFDNNNTPPWREINVTPGESFRILAFYQGNDMSWTAAPRIREIEFYDENNVKITGSPIGSAPWVGANEPSRAFDGNTTTFYQYSYRMAGYVGIDLGAGNAKQVSRIRYQFTGSSNALMSFVGINNDIVPAQVLSHIEGSDGRTVTYDYTVHNDPSGLFQWVTLSGATYPDETTATYSYKTLHDYAMPVIDTTNDPRYSGTVKQARYHYDTNAVIGFVTDQFDDASGQLIVSVRWDGPHIPKLVYPNGKIHRFEYQGGNVKRSIDSYGAYSDYTNIDGFITSSKDTLNRTTTYTRRADRRLISMTTPGGFTTTYTRNTAGYVMSVGRNGKVTSHVRDAQNRITRTNHPDGTYETWTYNSFGQRLTHRLRNGATESWTYNASGLLTQHIDEAGMLTTYTYNALNRLASETRHLDSSTAYTISYEYDDRGSLTKLTHPDGTFVAHAYDHYGNRLATLDERGQLIERTYDSLSRMLTETDPNGNITTYNYTSSVGGGCGCNTRGLPITITYPDGTVTLNTYDKEWRLLSTTHAHGTPQAATTSYIYDYAGQRSSMTDPLGRVTSYTYDLDGRMISETQAAGTPVALTTNRTFSVDGNLLSTTQGVGSPAAATTTMTYDAMDRVVSQTSAAGTPAASTTSRTYNALGQLISSTDPLGRVTTYSYDAAGRPTDTILPDGTTMRTVYDAFSRRVQSIAALGLPEESVTSVTYDGLDRVVTQTDPTGVTTTTTYDGGGIPLTITSPSGKSMAFTYDANGNRLQTITAPGTPEETTSSTTYDSRNRPVTQTDGEGSVTTMTYDPLGRTLTVKNALNHTTTYTYDLLGNPLTTRDADNVVTSTRTYDALDRLVSDKDGKNQTISYQYDALGRRTAYTDAKGATFSFQFDALGRLTRRTEPDGTFQTYTHDAAGRLLVHTKADGQTKTHIYGNADRDFLTQISYSNGEAPRLMSYDALGRLLSAVNANATITRSYDAASRITAEGQALTGGPSGTFGYQYDADGNLARHTRPDGSFIDYAWNARNLLAGITADAPPPLATYTYNGRYQIAATVIENGLFTAARSYDGAGRLTGVTNGALDSTGYTLSPDGRRTGITRNGESESYGYDNARQVTSASYGGLSTTQSWNYDAAGNRSSATTNGLTTTYLANTVNEYTSITGSPAPPMYDNNGNALSYPVKPMGSGALVSGVLTWNINNELIAATNGNGDSASYQYDALGRRVKTTSQISNIQSQIFFFYNGWNVELEHDGSDFTRRLSWGLDLSQSPQGAGGVGGLVMTEDLPSGGGAPVPHFPTYDGNGNITAWVNTSGTVTARQRYDAYGNIIEQTGTAPSNYGFSTKPMDQVTGLLYYGYRYYDPITGRWPSRDPIEEEGGINLYGFVGNNGVNWWDLYGLAYGDCCESLRLKYLELLKLLTEESSRLEDAEIQVKLAHNALLNARAYFENEQSNLTVEMAQARRAEAAMHIACLPTNLIGLVMCSEAIEDFNVAMQAVRSAESNVQNAMDNVIRMRENLMLVTNRRDAIKLSIQELERQRDMTLEQYWECMRKNYHN